MTKRTGWQNPREEVQRYCVDEWKSTPVEIAYDNSYVPRLRRARSAASIATTWGQPALPPQVRRQGW